MANNKARKNHTIALRLDNPTYVALEKIATKENRTISNLVRMWIKPHLDKRTNHLKKAS